MRSDEVTPDEWKLIGGNRIAVFRGGRTIRIAEFYELYDGENLPGAKNAELAVRAVAALRKSKDVCVEEYHDPDGRPSGWGNQ